MLFYRTLPVFISTIKNFSNNIIYFQKESMNNNLQFMEDREMLVDITQDDVEREVTIVRK